MSRSNRCERAIIRDLPHKLRMLRSRIVSASAAHLPLHDVTTAELSEISSKFITRYGNTVDSKEQTAMLVEYKIWVNRQGRGETLADWIWSYKLYSDNNKITPYKFRLRIKFAIARKRMAPSVSE